VLVESLKFRIVGFHGSFDRCLEPGDIEFGNGRADGCRGHTTGRQHRLQQSVHAAFLPCSYGRPNETHRTRKFRSRASLAKEAIEYAHSFPRRKTPGLSSSIALVEVGGRRESRMLDTHPQPRVRNKSRTRASSPQVRRNIPAFPARLVLTASFVLSLVIGLSCHHPRRDAQAPSPG